MFKKIRNRPSEMIQPTVSATTAVPAHTPETVLRTVTEQLLHARGELSVFGPRLSRALAQEDWMLATRTLLDLVATAAELSSRLAPVRHEAVERAPAVFDARPNKKAIRQRDEVLAISRDRSAQIVDARPAARFNGEVDEPRPGLHRGHIPGSLNVPWGDLVANGALKPNAELAAILHQHGVDFSRPVVASCGSGVTACVVILALHVLNVANVTLYDGAWSDWGSRNDMPITLD